MEISVKTAENHRTNLMGNLDVHNPAPMTRYVVVLGIVENTPNFKFGSIVGHGNFIPLFPT